MIYVSARVHLEQVFEVGVGFGGQVELFPDETGREEILVGGQGLPDISLFEGIFYESGVVAGVDNVAVFIFLDFAFHGSFYT